MKKSSTYAIIVSCFKKWISPISFFTILVLLFSGKTQAQSSDPFSLQNQTIFKIFQNSQAYLNPQTTTVNHESNTLQWEPIQTVVMSNPNSPLPPTKLNLDQVRNGSGASPVLPPTVAPWVNGNAGASNAHYAEGWSIPYRCIIDNLAAGSHSITIEWDTRQSNSSAIDFVTNYDFMDYPAGSHVNSFGHPQEVLNPLHEVGSYSSGNSVTILAPDFTGAPAAVTTYYNAVMAITNPGNPDLNANRFSVYNANITSFAYVAPQGNVLAAAASTKLKIFFENATAGTVVIAWGGHIAKGPGVWGDGNSAAAVSGSPYHTRLIEWDPDGAGPGGPSSIGNQDRSLSADAVLDPPVCELGGLSSVECSAVSTFTSGVNATDDLGSGNTFEWSITNNSNTCTATIIDGTHQDYVTVSNGSGCGCSYTIRYTLKKTTGAELSHCDKNVTVNDATAPLITCPSDVNLQCGASTSSANTGAATATDNCGTPTISFTDASVASNCTGRTGINRTWKATDACGNTATCLQQIRFIDNTAPLITCPSDANLQCGASTSTANTGTATATDNCGTATISFTDAAVASNCTGREGINRTWKATDGCGNTATCLQQIRFVDNTAPLITCPANANLQCGASTATDNTGSATATDNCGGSVGISFTDATVASNCTGRTGINRTWKATDGCGNTATCLQQIRFVDNTAPIITCPADVIVDCNGSTGTATATDNCDVNVSVTFTDQAANSTSCVTSITRKWTATDDCGNTATCVQHIIVRDRIGPVITCTTPTSATASDNCSGVTDIYLTNGVWTAIDGAGNITTANASTCVQSSFRAATSQVTAEQQSQQTTIIEEKTVAPIGKKELVKDITVQAIPNPFNDRVKFVVTVPQSGYATLDVMNMLGQKVKTVFQGRIPAGGQSFEMVLPKSRNTTLFYILRMNGKQVTGKLVQIN